jgi:histone H2A
MLKKEKVTTTERKSRSIRAGLTMPVARIKKAIAAVSRLRVGVGAPVYLGAVLEYICAEILELAGNASRDNKRVRIIPRHIMLCIKNDEELNKLFKDAIIANAGVIPNIPTVLLGEEFDVIDQTQNFGFDKLSINDNKEFDEEVENNNNSNDPNSGFNFPQTTGFNFGETGSNIGNTGFSFGGSNTGFGFGSNSNGNPNFVNTGFGFGDQSVKVENSGFNFGGNVSNVNYNTSGTSLGRATTRSKKKKDYDSGDESGSAEDDDNLADDVGSEEDKGEDY